MKISIEPETPEEIQTFKPVKFLGLQSMLVLGILRNDAKQVCSPYSMYGNVKLLLEQLPEVTFQLTLIRKQAEAAQQPRIAVPKMRFADGDGKRIG